MQEPQWGTPVAVQPAAAAPAAPKPLGVEDFGAIKAMQLAGVKDKAQWDQAQALIAKFTPAEDRQFKLYSQLHRPDNPDTEIAFGLLGGLSVARAVAGTASMVAKVGAGVKAALGQAAPIVKFEGARMIAEGLGAKPQHAIMIASAVTGFNPAMRGIGKIVDAAKGAAKGAGEGAAAEATVAARAPAAVPSGMGRASEPAYRGAPAPTPQTAVPPVPAPAAAMGADAVETGAVSRPAPSAAAAPAPASAQRPARAPKLSEADLSAEERQALEGLVKEGHSKKDVLAELSKHRAATAPAAPAQPAAPPAPTPAAPARAGGAPRLAAAETTEYLRLIRLGKTPAEAMEQIAAERAMVKRLGLPDPEEARTYVRDRNATGRWGGGQ